MKRTFFLGACVLAAGLMTPAALAQGPGSDGIVGSAHDFSAYGWSDNEICKPCHTPHNSNTAVEAAPLWNHALPAGPFEMHSASNQLPAEALDGGSILCMGCHDGVTAMDSFGGVTGTQLMVGDEVLGLDLTDDHPVGIDAIYEDFPWMEPPASWEGGHGSASGNPRKFTLKPMDVAGRGIVDVVGCSTCHEPHNNHDQSGTSMLHITTTNSELCQWCHTK